MPDGPERDPFLGFNPPARDRGVQERTEVHGLQHGRKVVEHDRGGFDPDVLEPGPAEVPAELPVGPPVGEAGGALVCEAADHVRVARVEGKGAPVGFDREHMPARADPFGKRQASNPSPEPASSTRMPGASPRVSRLRAFNACTQERSLTSRR